MLHLPEHLVSLDKHEEALKQMLLPLMAEGRFDPPWVRELAATVHRHEDDVRALQMVGQRHGHMQGQGHAHAQHQPVLQFTFSRAQLVLAGGCVLMAASLIVLLGVGVGAR